MKKEKLGLTTFIALLSIQIVSAQYEFTNQVMNFVGQTVNSFIGIILAIVVPLTGIQGSPEFLIAKVLFFFVMISIVFISLRNVKIFDENKWALIIITLAVSILSTRYLPDGGVIQAILLPYSAFGATVGILLPLITMFFFINFIAPESTFFRRLLWVMYGSFYAIIWYQRYTTGGWVFC